LVEVHKVSEKEIAMHKFMCAHTLPAGGFAFKDICELADALQHESHVRGYRSFLNLTDGKALCVLEAADREAIASWFEEKGIPYDYIVPVELEGEYGTIRDLKEEPVMAGSA
jgi:hypothetical protein